LLFCNHLSTVPYLLYYTAAAQFSPSVQLIITAIGLHNYETMIMKLREIHVLITALIINIYKSFTYLLTVYYYIE